MNETSQNTADTLLRAVRQNWTVGYGAITMPILAGLFLPKVWVTVVCLLAAWALSVYSRSDRSDAFLRSPLIVDIARRALVASAAVMFAVVVLCTDWLVPTVIHLQLYNSEIPFVTCLIVFPCTALMCVGALYFGLGARRSRDNQRRSGLYAGDSIAATLFYRESRYQVLVLLIVSLLLAGVEYWYYFARYINSDMNAPDRFFFNYMPVAMYIISLLFMGGRYASMRGLLMILEARHLDDRESTLVRFLIFRSDDLLLHQSPGMQWDTPAEIVVGRTASVGESQARLYLSQQTGLSDFALRYLYTNEGFGSSPNVIHYAAFVNDDMKEAFASEDQWFNPYMLDSALAANELAPLLANELFRIHTMTMAWKTYTREGMRLYPVKHYRPTFRFRDLRDWTLDYDDALWFDVAHNNEDRSFFHTRRLWHRMTAFASRKPNISRQ